MPYAYARCAALIVCVCLAGLASAPSARAETLRLGGTGSASELLRRLGPAFEAEGAVRLELIPSLGSSGAIRALADGAIDLAVTGRRLKPQELASGLSVLLALRTPFVLATSHRRPDAMTLADVADAFRSQRAAWSDGVPIRPILRPETESDITLIGELFPDIARAIVVARGRPDIPVAATDQDNAEMAEQTPGSLVMSTLTQITMERRDLRLVPIDGVEPTFENFERGLYTHTKSLFVVGTRGSASAERFAAFLRSSAGQRILRDAKVL